jgi:hypothetical protein
MHYHNAACFGHIRPSSGSTFIRHLMHCALIEYHSFRYVVDVFFFIYFLRCGCFSAMYNTYLINIILLLVFGYIFLCIYMFLYLHISLVCCFLDCAYQVSLCVLCIDFGVSALAYISLYVSSVLLPIMKLMHCLKYRVVYFDVCIILM